MENNNWLDTKFVNPRDIEGEPNTEKLEYIRGLIESFSETDERFIAAFLLGSTITGHSYPVAESTRLQDIDISIIYNEKPKKIYTPAREFLPGVKLDGGIVLKYDFFSSFSKHMEEYNRQLRADNKPVFSVDLNPMHFNLHEILDFGLLSGTRLRSDTFVTAYLLMNMCYPSITTNNPKAKFSLEKVQDIVQRSLSQAGSLEISDIRAEINRLAIKHFGLEYDKYSERTTADISRDDYIKKRILMLEKKLVTKFDFSLGLETL